MFSVIGESDSSIRSKVFDAQRANIVLNGEDVPIVTFVDLKMDILLKFLKYFFGRVVV